MDITSHGTKNEIAQWANGALIAPGIDHFSYTLKKRTDSTVSDILWTPDSDKTPGMFEWTRALKRSPKFIFIYQEGRWMTMIKKYTTIVIVLVCIFLFCVGPASAAINTINPGNAVFIGEQGLDISAAMGPDTKIGWWPSAAVISTTSPPQSIDLTGRITSFMVSETEFAGYLGNWYRLNNAGKADGIAFLVVDPQLVLKVEDTTVQVDVELLKWIPSGDDIQFRIDTNLAQMASQRSTPPPITIKVESPDGAIYSSLLNAGGAPTSIVNIPVTAVPFYTGSIWNMGNPAIYAPGTYTLWAESNVNQMNDNYPVTGKTISKKITLLNQGQNPLITKATTVPTTRAPTQTTPQATTQTVVSTTVLTPSPTEPPTTAATVVPSPSPKAPGFEATLAIAAILCGLAVYLKKE